MKIFITSDRILLAGLLLFSGFNFCEAMFKKGDHCKIVRGYLKGGAVEIEGTCQQIFDIEDAKELASNENLWRNPALANYLSICFSGVDEAPCLDLLSAIGGSDRALFWIKEDCNGLFYYGKLLGSGKEYCLNPMWLVKMSGANTESDVDDEKATEIGIEQRLFEIFKEIRLIQHSCQYADWQYRVPLKHRGISFSELQDKQRSLFPEMRKLKASLPAQQVESIANRADKAAHLEIEGITSCDMASAMGSISSNRGGCPLQ
jgi:hypothetical protein